MQCNVKTWLVCSLAGVGALLFAAVTLAHPLDHERSAGCPDCYQKPGADVRLLDHQPAQVEPGEVADITLALTSGASSGTLTVRVAAVEGLTLLSADSFVFPLDGRQAYRLPLQVQTSEPGRYYLNLYITLDDDRGLSTRALSAIVQAGAARESRPGVAAKAEPEEAAARVRLPARETIVQP